MNKAVKDILRKELKAKVNGRLWLEADGERFFGPGPVELLERIANSGSISAAAKEMDMSYKKAWALINHLNAQTSVPMVVAQTGGEKGGGSVVTPEALELIAYYRALRERFSEFLKQETQNLRA
jgi:molybdate transport system regulatory protein